MKAMLLKKLQEFEEGKAPLVSAEMPEPVPGDGEILVRVVACGVCHTELDEIEGRTPPPVLPVIPGHQIVGRVERTARAGKFEEGERVGIGWIYSACGQCRFCTEGNENLCDDFRATGRDAHGGYAEYVTVREDFAYPIPDGLSDFEAAPLLCAGAIGYRSLRLCGIRDGDTIGLTGFGASGHLVIKMVAHRYPASRIFVFSRTKEEREFALELGAYWTGDIGEESPERLRAAIDTTPAWKPVVETMKNLEKGGRLVINAIRKEERDKEALLGIDYGAHLWMEKEIKSVANLTRKDVAEFLKLASEVPIKPEVQTYRLEEANKALGELKERKIRGAKVLLIG
ncbi:MAG: zinc-dependent alcohol dehydrogenase family protein [Nitrospirae bacterium]|nr:zinc-dependent alcohol dehydrogenase family protein [Nitrospirota bacterium]